MIVTTPPPGTGRAVLLTSSGAVLLLPFPGPDGRQWMLPPAPDTPAAVVRHVRTHLRGEVFRLRRLSSCPEPIWSARVVGHRPGTWMWHPDPETAAVEGALPPTIAVHEAPPGGDSVSAAVAALTGPARDLLLELAETDRGLELLLGPRAIHV